METQCTSWHNSVLFNSYLLALYFTIQRDAILCKRINEYYGRGKIRTQNNAMWNRPQEMERPILLSVMAQYVDKSLSIETEEADRSRSSKSEHSSKGFK